MRRTIESDIEEFLFRKSEQKNVLSAFERDGKKLINLPMYWVESKLLNKLASEDLLM